MSFSVDELRRLSEAATQADQRISHEVFRGLSVLVRADLLREKACTFEAMAAYLGTHREAILRMLEAADALAAILQHEALSDVALATLDVYEEAKGA